MRRVVKIGGSLLRRDDLVPTLTRWFVQQQPAENLVVVGGGAVVDAIRELDEIRPGDPVETHWLCVSLLDVTLRRMASWFPWPVVTTPEELRRGLSTGFATATPTLVGVGAFYGPEAEGASDVLPTGWETTTDSIAAWLALQVDAGELVILKSCDVNSDWSPEQLSAAGIVDEAFPGIARRIDFLRVERL